MALGELRRLWALQGVDSAIQTIKAQAARLDVGQAESAKIKKLEAEDNEETVAARTLVAEQFDLELKQRGFADKIAKFQKQLFDPRMTSAREVAAIEKEIEMLKRQSGALDDRLLELFELVPNAKKTLEATEAEIAETKKAIAEKRRNALAQKAKLEAAYAEAVARRKETASDVPAPLLAKYEAIRARYEGVGMAEIVKGKNCSACGTHQPERIVQAALDGAVVTCESCHRILYYSTGVV